MQNLKSQNFKCEENVNEIDLSMTMIIVKQGVLKWLSILNNEFKCKMTRSQSLHSL